MKLLLSIEAEGETEEAFFILYDGMQTILDYIETKYKLMGTVLPEIKKDVEAHMMKLMIPNVNVVSLDEYRKKSVGRELDEEDKKL